MLFDAIFTAVFEKIAFNLTKIIQGTCLGPFLLKTCFWKGNRKGKILSSQGKNRTKLACLVQILQFFISKKHFFGQKKLRTVMRTVKNQKCICL
jgi:hypothetical protein